MKQTFSKEFQSALDVYMQHLVDDYKAWQKRGKYAGDENMLVTIEPGSKFVKIVHSTYNQRSVHSFVALPASKWAEGDILKPAGWKAPAQNFIRGNIFKPDSYKTRASWSGVH